MQGFENFETPEGQEMMEELGQAIGEALEGMDPEQLEQIGETIDELSEAFGELSEALGSMPEDQELFSTPASQELGWPRAAENLEVDELMKAPTMEIQAREIGEYFRETPELQYENWVKLSPEQRLQALQGLENEAAAIAHRPPMQVSLKELEFGTLGLQTSKGLDINVDIACNDNHELYVKTLETLIHEGRHAYQGMNIALAEAGNPVIEQNTTWVNSWRVNQLDLGYSDGEFDIDGLGFERYYTQPVEVDARAFAAQTIYEMGLRKAPIEDNL